MKPLKEAASLILAARYGPLSGGTAFVNTYNYKILSLKRHSNSKTLAGAHVFPGGMVHAADADLRWNDLFFKFGFDKNSFSPLFPDVKKDRPSIFTAKPGDLPKEISLRITSIRETFEECGLLLCKRRRDSEKQSVWATHMSVSELELRDWQSKVHADPSEFFTMCEKFKCYPDLWSLHEWSNWMTPTSFLQRFNTVFFLACMPFLPRANYEATEMEGLDWLTPKFVLEPSAQLFLPPPQHYEIARLSNVTDLNELLEFAVKRRKNGIGTHLPVQIDLQDGNIFVLPGDTMYPENLSLTERQIIDKADTTIKEFNVSSPIKNRWHFTGQVEKRLLIENFKDKHGHLVPMPSERPFTPSKKPKL